MIGDNGFIDYHDETDTSDRTSDIDEMASKTTTQAGGVDVIDAGDGDDFVIGGRFGDTIRARNGDNLIFGDSGRILAATMDSETQPHFGGHLITLGRVETIEDTDGGADTIRSLAGYDIVLGGHEGDNIQVSQIANLEAESSDTASDDSNIVFGDTGYIDYDDDLAIPASAPSNAINPDDIDLIVSTTTTAARGVNANLNPIIVAVGGADIIESGDGDDIVVGGRFDDTIRARNGDNLIFGDSGRVLAATLDSAAQPHFEGHRITLGRVETIENTDGGIDTVRSLTGYDIVLGGHAGDTIRVSLIADLEAESNDVASDDSNIVLGDAGYIDYDNDQAIPASSPSNAINPDDIDEVVSTTVVPTLE